MERDSFIFYRYYKEAFDNIENKELRLELYEIIVNYALYNIYPENKEPLLLAIFELLKNDLDKKCKSYFSFEDRRSSKYKKWKQSVLKRDNYKCQKCGSTENIVAHHIKEFSKYKEERYNIKNGITLCQNCHREVHKK